MRWYAVINLDEEIYEMDPLELTYTFFYFNFLSEEKNVKSVILYSWNAAVEDHAQLIVIWI